MRPLRASFLRASICMLAGMLAALPIGAPLAQSVLAYPAAGQSP